MADVNAGRDAYTAGRDLIVNPDSPARSAYLQQVRRIGPVELVGRDAELAELAEFSVSGPPWAWWQAPAWSGKSALMAWFVLHPPPGVQVVSFFITSRWAGQNDRTAFVDIVLQQLAEVAGRPMPRFLTEATRELDLLDMLEKAARLCGREEQRLLLVIDGLDEDRGVTAGPDAHSIAAILPARLPDGVRVLVAGRPNPPVPPDVDADHPLRDPGVVRKLPPSERAKAIKGEAQRELKELLYGEPAEQDLLGLVAAAGGGLSGGDLAALTGWPVPAVEDRLFAVSGRTFSSRAARWDPNTLVYVLAHEELQQQALAYLGEPRLEGYRQRLHTWADTWRDRHWPAETPEYLLHGYHRLLVAREDVPRMLACDTDPERQDRQLAMTGGDTTALDQIAAAQDVICGHHDPDLRAMLRLAMARDRLIDRNTGIPVELPATWALLGHLARAESLARSIADPQRRERALIELAGAVAAADPGRGERIARSVDSRAGQALALVRVAGAMTEDPERAEDLARSIPLPAQRAQALADLAEIAGRRLLDEAEDLARSVTHPEWRLQALTGLVRPAVACGDADRAARLIEETEPLARSVAHPDGRARALLTLVVAVAAAGDPGRAERVARAIDGLTEQAVALIELVRTVAATGDFDRAKALAASVHDAWRAPMLVELAEATTAGDLDRAVILAREIDRPTFQAKASLRLVRAIAVSGDLDRARLLTEEAERLARSAGASARRVQALLKLSRAVAAGAPDLAEAVARAIPDRAERARALTEVVKAVAATGDLGRTGRLVRSITDRRRRARALAEGVRAVGDLAAAEQLARSGADAYERACGLLAAAQVAAGDADRARLMSEAEALADPLPPGNRRERVLRELAYALAATGDLDRAESVAGSVTPDSRRAGVLAKLAGMIAATGDLDRAETLARSVSGEDQRARALVAVVAAARDRDRAEAIALAIAPGGHRALALARLAESIAAAGDLDRAETLARSITRSHARAQALIVLVRVAAEAGDLDRAEALAQSLDQPPWQAEALAGIAEAVDSPRTRRGLAAALRAGSWTLSLPALARMAPEAVREVAAELS